MNRLKKYWIFIGVTVLLIALLGISFQYVSAEKPPDAQPPLNVDVKNEADNPIPVYGGVTVNGISDVNVTNSTLPVTGTVEVNNSTENPVFVSDVSYSNIQPFVWSGDFSDLNSSNSFTVPADKMLVIELATIKVSMSYGGVITPYIRARTSGTDYEHYIPVTTQDYSTSSTFKVGAESVKIYVDRGSLVLLYWHDILGTIINARLSISGYLVDAP